MKTFHYPMISFFGIALALLAFPFSVSADGPWDGNPSPALQQESETSSLTAMLVPSAPSPQADSLASEVSLLRQRLDVLEAEASGSAFRSDEVCPGWRFQVDYLNWTLRRHDLDFAVTTDDSALAVGAGSVRELEFGRDSGVRTGLAYQTGTGWEIGFAYTYFHTSAMATAQAPAGGNLWATRTHPDRYEEALTASGQNSFDYDVFDLEAGHTFLMNRFAAIKILGGLRWANIEQTSVFQYDGADFSNGQISAPLDMTAFGIRLGMQGDWRLANGWSLFGRGAGSLMYGQFQSRLRETNLSGTEVLVDVDNDYERAVPVLEAAAGVSWHNRWLEVAAGYELTNWFNLADRSAFCDDVHEGLYAPSSDDILMDGLFLRCVVTR